MATIEIDRFGSSMTSVSIEKIMTNPILLQSIAFTKDANLEASFASFLD